MSELHIKKVREVRPLMVASLVIFTDGSSMTVKNEQMPRVKPGQIFEFMRYIRGVTQFLVCDSLREGKIVPENCYDIFRGGSCIRESCEVGELDVQEGFEFWIEGFEVDIFKDCRGEKPVILKVNKHGDIISS